MEKQFCLTRGASKSNSISVFALAAVLLGVVAVAVAGDQVPVQGRVVGSVQLTPPPNGGGVPFRADYDATGVMSHLGRISAMWASPVVELDLEKMELIVDPPTWTGTIIAANGDEIFGEYRLDSGRIPFTLQGEIAFPAELEVTGGTGRFTGVTGSGVAIFRANLFTMRFVADVEGTMSTIGSVRRRR